MRIPRWLSTEKSNTLRKILLASPDEKLKEAAREVLLKRGESLVLLEKESADEEESAALKLCREQVQLMTDLRFRRCKLVTTTGYEKSGTIVTVRPVYELEKNYAHIRTDDGDTYIRSVGSVDLMILDEIDEKRMAALGASNDYTVEGELRKNALRQARMLREAHEGLEKVGMLVQLKDSTGMPVIGRVVDVSFSRDIACYVIFYNSVSEGRRKVKRSIKAAANYEFYPDSETPQRNEKAVAKWQKVFERYEDKDCEF